MYNKFLEPYLKLLIQEEKKKIGNRRDYSNAKLYSLEKMLRTHQTQVSILTEAIKSKSVKEVSKEEVKDLKKQLFSLKHSGSKFKDIIYRSNKNTSSKCANFDILVNV